ncbi:Crp/Fnr family transcriptional regulator [Flavitalea sp. BT771]|uniref:Crp/Fnr family transcriptional regulator n=1 Tax=Flavitalea sp. BT771 TaxID=3063329 RepID=UPI0026E2108D|nr:Crp/Fnr family transcriptional regulator [Flavitalea sp. BT771]MDO6432057.1 Crp/Fnr family transcriptional regulator [Flavitalea sp. BT771]MDV6220966.1 Crp/Fnr family transcriptional regulator [Flavitalea sp. BT771]
MQELSCNLNDCFLCRHCMPEWREVIALKKTTLPIKKGKPVFREGEKVAGIFFLYSGYVKVHKEWIGQKDLILRFAAPGDILGHRGLGGIDHYPVTATALEDCQVCHISNDFLESSLKANPNLTYRLMYFYAAELQRTEQRMRDMVHMEVKGRIAGALLEITKLSLTVTRQDIASYAGTTYETVFKFLTELTKGKVISASGKNIRIIDPARLKKYIMK